MNIERFFGFLDLGMGITICGSVNSLCGYSNLGIVILGIFLIILGSYFLSNDGR